MIKDDVLEIISTAIKASLPYEKTRDTLRSLDLPQGNIYVLAVGKAAIPMARGTAEVLGDRIKKGLAVTKYDHTGDFSSPYFEVIESAHPISDENSILAARKALEFIDPLTQGDTLLVLMSGGASALFEDSFVDPETQRDISRKLLARGAQIEEINIIRRRLSKVKGGKLAQRAYPAKVITLALSDVLSNSKPAIGGGITVPEDASWEQVREIARKYLYDVPLELFAQCETKAQPVNDGGYYFVGDINSLCDSAVEKARQLGYTAVCLSKSLTGEAREVARDILKAVPEKPGRFAYIYGGETTVTLKGKGLGGRNQEMALAAAIELENRKNIIFASVGSDGTDGPTDAAGGIVSAETVPLLKAKGIDPLKELEDNNSYFALKQADALVITNPTGTNVNDITVVASC